MGRTVSTCIECGENTPSGKYTHPDWPADDICIDCHGYKWDEWIESKIEEYLDEVGVTGEHSLALKDWIQQ